MSLGAPCDDISREEQLEALDAENPGVKTLFGLIRDLQANSGQGLNVTWIEAQGVRPELDALLNAGLVETYTYTQGSLSEVLAKLTGPAPLRRI